MELLVPGPEGIQTCNLFSLTGGVARQLGPKFYWGQYPPWENQVFGLFLLPAFKVMATISRPLGRNEAYRS